MAVSCSNDELASAMDNSEMECDYVSYVVNDVLNAEINRSEHEYYDRMTNKLDESNTNSLCSDKEISGDERSNNALSKHFEQTKQCSPITDYQSLMKNTTGDYQPTETKTLTDNQYLMDENLFKKVERPEIDANDNDTDDGICVLRKARSDELLTLKHHIQVRNSLENLDGFPTSVSETDGQEYLDLQDEYHDECGTYDLQYQYNNCGENLEANMAEYNLETKRRDSQSTEESSTKELPKYVPGTSVKDGIEENDENTDDEDNEEEDRMIGIEEEYIQRIASLEERQYELEDVIARLTSTVETLTMQPTDENENGALDDIEAPMSENGATASNEQPVLDKAKIGTSELLMEFQDKIRHFALDLNGVLNCSEAAIRHARVVQEWAISVQKMFEQMKTDRQRMQTYIEEREKTLLSIKDQFLIELQRQNQQVKRIVQELRKHGDLKEKTDKYLYQKVGDRLLKSPEKPSRRPMEESLLDLLMTRRIENDEALVLSMAKQSKISELKLTIISQQNCIQQLQQQNKELRAIIEGLVGSYPSDDEEEEEEENGEKDATKDSMRKPSSPFKLPAEVTGDKGEISQISDVLACDRGRYFPGRSYDGDIATIQTFQIGDDIIDPTENEEKIFEPLKINYIKEQCKSAEEKTTEVDMKADTEGSVCQEPNEKKDEVTYGEVENTQFAVLNSGENVPLETVAM
ncbi:hypothetical protein CHS0354_038672 [Potamilus streckersoni]|uniref:Uncharacterized protein n=1 Tax=Potamilus streckersoni TaxID=2493646 RepID=A0AAE0W7U8_9BIVA|nr:hypothetical protein CHS0354_038672 [Potamilus streckersoni]